MTDRELLELAAKAAGVEYSAEESKPHPKSRAFWGLWLVIHGEPYEGQRRYWNPLADDGDALRLAVKLGLRVDVADEDVRAEYGLHTCGRVGIASEPHGDNVCAATRRAIVRAAAEIGKGMA